MSRHSTEFSYRKAVWGSRPSAVNAKSLDLNANYNDNLTLLSQQSMLSTSIQRQGTVKSSLTTSVASVPMGTQAKQSA